MQKALFEMNVQLTNVISDITGETGLRILRAIIAGDRDPKQLAALCSSRIKVPRETVAKSLHGNWDQALLHCLKSALESYEFIERQIQECDLCVHRQLTQTDSRAPLPQPAVTLKAQLHRVCGVDLTKIPGIKEQTAQVIISEIRLAKLIRLQATGKNESQIPTADVRFPSEGRPLRRSILRRPVRCPAPLPDLGHWMKRSLPGQDAKNVSDSGSP
jgi:hypothetical protein